MKIPTRHLLISAATLALLSPPLASAKTADDSSADAAAPSGEDIVVTGHVLKDMGLMAGSIEIEGDALVRIQAAQIGDMLASLPGVSATSFAPGASRPVLRGLTGDRVQVLLDGIGSIDASSVSADHGVAIDTLTIDHIDVLHGPALLAYGGQAIGGAVNATDKRIPRKLPDGPFDLTVLGSLSSVAGEKSAAGSLDIPLGSRFAAHLDASWHSANDQRVGGSVLSEPLKAEVLGLAADLRAEGELTGAAELDAAAALKGRVPGSFTRGSTVGAGLAFIDSGGSLGVSFQHIDNRYGIPARPGAGESGVSIAMAQTRLDLRGHVDTSGFIESIQFRAAYGDYHHSELEDGEAGTRFARQGIESRLELVQEKRGGWSGRSGIQYTTGKLSVTGEEAILPANEDTRLGLFTLQSLRTGIVELEAAARLERVAIKAAAAGFDRTFHLHSAALGASLHPSEGLKIGINWSHGERAPSPEELLTNGVHVATQAFEIGNPGFNRERSNGFEAFVQYDGPTTRLSLTGYRTRFAGFITPIPTGTLNEGVPVYEYRQLPATFTGYEVQVTQKLMQWGNRTFSLDASSDYVRANLKANGPVPRIPPLRLMGGVEYAAPNLTLRGEVEWNAAQRRVGTFENPTRSFTLLNANATWRPMGQDGPLTVILSAENLLNVVGRRAASFTRDFMPIAGRDVKLTARISL